MTNPPQQFTSNQKRSFNTTEEKKEEKETVNVLRTVTQLQRRCQTDSVKTFNSNLKFQHQQPNFSQPLSP
jgi:hypothetical protein